MQVLGSRPGKLDHLHALDLSMESWAGDVRACARIILDVLPCLDKVYCTVTVIVQVETEISTGWLTIIIRN